MGQTIKLKGGAARNFFAARMVDEYGDKAADKCAEGGPMHKAVMDEIIYRQTTQCMCTDDNGEKLNQCNECPR